MKEVKAYIKPQAVNRVIEALEREGITDMTLIDVRSISKFVQPQNSKYSLELAEKYMDVIKLELVCEDDQAEKAVEIVVKTARSGRKGDGMIFVTNVEKLVQI